MLVFDDIEAHHADLSPGSPDISPVVAMITQLADVLTPCPVPEAPPAIVELADLVHGWGELATAPPADLDGWTRRHLDDLATLETHWLSAAEGKTLLHGDINQSNLLVDRTGGVVLIDWAQPVRGGAWIDVADLVPPPHPRRTHPRHRRTNGRRRTRLVRHRPRHDHQLRRRFRRILGSQLPLPLASWSPLPTCLPGKRCRRCPRLDGAPAPAGPRDRAGSVDVSRPRVCR